MATSKDKTASKIPASPKSTSIKKASGDSKVTATKIGSAIKAEKSAAPKKTASAKPNKVGAEEHYRMTEVAAYFLAERNKFAGHPIDYWAQAEEQVNRMLNNS